MVIFCITEKTWNKGRWLPEDTLQFLEKKLFREKIFTCHIYSKRIIYTPCLLISHFCTGAHSNGCSHTAFVLLGNLQPFKEKSLLLALILGVLTLSADDEAGLFSGKINIAYYTLERSVQWKRGKFACTKCAKWKKKKISPWIHATNLLEVTAKKRKLCLDKKACTIHSHEKRQGFFTKK